MPPLVFHDKQAWQRWSYPVLLTRSWQTQAPGKMPQSFTLARILSLQTALRLEKLASRAVWNREDTSARIFKTIWSLRYNIDLIHKNIQWLQSHKMESESMSNVFPNFPDGSLISTYPSYLPFLFSSLLYYHNWHSLSLQCICCDTSLSFVWLCKEWFHCCWDCVLLLLKGQLNLY